MRFVLLLAVIVKLNGAFAACEDRLWTQPFAQVTARLLKSGVVTPEQLVRVVNSSVPISPLENETPHPRISHPIEFYRRMVAARDTQENWPQIREQIRDLLKGTEAERELLAAARKETESIMLAGEEKVWPQFNLYEVYDWFHTKDHRTLVPSYDGRWIVRDFQSGKVVSRLEEKNPGIKPQLRLNDDDQIETSVLQREDKKQSWSEWYRHYGETRFVKTVLNLQTGAKAQREFYLPYADKEVRYFSAKKGFDLVSLAKNKMAVLADEPFVFDFDKNRMRIITGRDGSHLLVERVPGVEGGTGESLTISKFDDKGISPIHHRRFKLTDNPEKSKAVQLRNGKFVFAAADVFQDSTGKSSHRILYSPAFPLAIESYTLNMLDEAATIDIYESQSGRVFLSTRTNTKPWRLKVFEPEVNRNPIFEFESKPGEGLYHGFFESQDRVFLHISTNDHNILFFEPGFYETPVAEIKTDKDYPLTRYRVHPTQTRQVYVGVESQNEEDYKLKVFSLYNALEGP